MATNIDIEVTKTEYTVDITVEPNEYIVNITTSTGGGGVESINGETGVVVLTTDNVNEGLINLYFTAARVRATVLTGISFVSGIAITATDTILSAFGKLQKQISSLGAVAFSNNYNDLDNKPTIPTPQNLAQTLAIDNKTNDIPIVSNNGMARVDVNDDYLYISYEGNYLTLEPTNGLQLLSNTKVFTNAPYMDASIDNAISYTCPSFLLNGEEVATQDWVTSQGYGTGTVTSVTGDLVDNTDPLNPIVGVPTLQQITDNESGVSTTTGAINPESLIAVNGVQGSEVSAINGTNVIGLKPDYLNIAFINGTFESLLTANAINDNYSWSLPNQSGTIALTSDITNEVDSVNGKTGVVVLDTSDIADTTNKRYVTDAQLVVIGNTSNTNSGDNATNTKYEAVARTGAVVAFDVDAVYNSIASPSSSNLTDDLTGARLKIVQKIYHNAGTAPTVPAGWVRRGTGTYVTSTLNIIYAEWSVGTTVEYWITQ